MLRFGAKFKLINFFHLFLGAARKKATANNIWWLISVCMAEVIGTGMLVFFGCIGGVPSILEEEPSLLQKCIVFGLAVATIIQVRFTKLIKNVFNDTCKK